MTDRSTNPLQRLIRERLRERGWSYGDVARRGALPRSTVYNLARTRNLTRPPRAATIDALAKGLGVPVTVVRAAAAESTGLHYYEDAPRGQGHVEVRDAEPHASETEQRPPTGRRHAAAPPGPPSPSMAAGLAPASPGDLAEAAHPAFQRPAETGTRPAMPGSAPDDDSAQLLLRVVMLLTSPAGWLYWKHHLGLDPTEAAETADWAIKILTNAQRELPEAGPR